MPVVEQAIAESLATAESKKPPLPAVLRYLMLLEWFAVIVIGFAAIVLWVVVLLYVIYHDALPEMTRAFGPLRLITGVSTATAMLGYAAARSLQRRHAFWPLWQGILLFALLALGVTISVTMGRNL